jgi:transcriptional regulator GlxA family with amidase domain
MQRIAHVIQMLKTKFSEPIRVEDLAENGPYEPVVFPLSFQRRDDHETRQYQKRVRLLEARHLLLVEGHGRGKRGLSCRL